MARQDSTIMTAEEVAKFLGIHRETVYLYAKKGKIPAFKIGYNWRFKKESIDKWMEEKENSNFKKKSDSDS
jgi:excisionase family DNA binding protein